MGCGIYPNEEEFAKRLEEEAVFQIKRLRNHPSLALWAGDNECDHEMRGNKLDPNRNILTRSVLKKCVELHDYARPYLPSSPYISTPAFRGEGLMPEEHLWGPRDYFKGPYYRDTFCHFASETGYHGFPSVTSLKKFLKVRDTAESHAFVRERHTVGIPCVQIDDEVMLVNGPDHARELVEKYKLLEE